MLSKRAADGLCLEALWYNGTWAVGNLQNQEVPASLFNGPSKLAYLSLLILHQTRWHIFNPIVT